MSKKEEVPFEKLISSERKKPSWWENIWLERKMKKIEKKKISEEIERQRKFRETFEPLTKENNPFENVYGTLLEVDKKTFGNIGDKFKNVFKDEEELEKLSGEWGGEGAKTKQKLKREKELRGKVKEEKLRVFNELLDEKKGNEDFRKIVEILDKRIYSNEDKTYHFALAFEGYEESIFEKPTNFLVVDEEKIEEIGNGIYGEHWDNYITIEKEGGERINISTPTLNAYELHIYMKDIKHEREEIMFNILRPFLEGKKEEEIPKAKKVIIKKFGIKVNY